LYIGGQTAFSLEALEDTFVRINEMALIGKECLLINRLFVLDCMVFSMLMGRRALSYKNIKGSFALDGIHAPYTNHVLIELIF
jgi:hypothetical protein